MVIKYIHPTEHLYTTRRSECGVCISPERRIIDLTFFFPHPIIVLERYTDSILFALSAQSDEGEINEYFQQNGTIAHIVWNSMKLLRKFFRDSYVYRGFGPKTVVSCTTTFLFRGNRKGKGL